MKDRKYVEAMAQIRLTDEQKDRVRRNIESRLKTDTTAKRYPLKAICAAALAVALLSGMVFSVIVLFSKPNNNIG